MAPILITADRVSQVSPHGIMVRVGAALDNSRAAMRVAGSGATSCAVDQLDEGRANILAGSEASHGAFTGHLTTVRDRRHRYAPISQVATRLAEIGGSRHVSINNERQILGVARDH
jgi:hypothetical protein